MLGTYPILIDGEETGTLIVRREGIMTVFEAQCADTGALLRLSAYGEREGYLGVMMPDGGGRLMLRKRLSRAALADFPQTIRFAAPAGLKPAEPAEVVSEPEKTAAEKPAEEASGPTEPCAPAPDCPPEPQPVCAEDAGTSEEKPEDEEITLWRHGAGGALVGAAGTRRLLAVPLKSGVAPMGGKFEKRRIDGMDYAVFEIKNGKII